jgi:hypothetical protein
MLGVFGDGMVVQHDNPLLHGCGAPAGHRIGAAVKDHSANKTTATWTTADQEGCFVIALDPRPQMYFPSDNLSVIVKLATGKSNSPSFATARDVMFGTVILCSGQSNMVHPLSYDYNATEQLAAAKLLPNLRLFQVGRQWSNNGSMANSLPLGECLISTPHARGHTPFAGGFTWPSAVCLRFAC